MVCLISIILLGAYMVAATPDLFAPRDPDGDGIYMG